jgi:hypothetical protein
LEVKLGTSPKPKPAATIPEPPPTFSVPEKNPPSSDPERVAIRVDGITYLVWAAQVEQFKARYAGQTKRDAHAEIYE